MAEVGTAYISVDGDYRKFNKDTDKALGKAKSKFSGLTKAATGALALGGGAAVIALAKSSVGAASDINESLSKNKVLFGQYAAAVAKFSNESAESFGISKKAVLEYTGTFGNLFRAFGTSQKESAKFSVGLTKLAADMASFNNTSIEDALEAIRSGLVGETEPLRKFGVNLSQASLQAEAVSSGLVKATKDTGKIKIAQENLILVQAKYNKAVKEHGKSSEEAKRALIALQKAQGAVNKEVSGSVPQLTAQQRALAAQQLIIKQTAAAHGDFRRTSKGLANQQRILTAEFDNAKAELGSALLPVLLQVVRALTKTIGFLKEHKTAVGVAVAAWASYRLAAKAALAATRLQLIGQFLGLGAKATASGAASGAKWGGAFNKAARSRLLKLLPAGLTVTVVVAFQWAVNKAIAKLLNIPANSSPVGRTFNAPGAALDDIVHGRNPLKGDRRGPDVDRPHRIGKTGVIEHAHTPPFVGGSPTHAAHPDYTSPPHAPSGRTFRSFIENVNVITPVSGAPDGRHLIAQLDMLAAAR